jgi:ribosomal protein S18
LSIQQQRAVAKAIRKARDLKLIPFVYDVKS